VNLTNGQTREVTSAVQDTFLRNALVAFFSKRTVFFISDISEYSFMMWSCHPCYLPAVLHKVPGHEPSQHLPVAVLQAPGQKTGDGVSPGPPGHWIEYRGGISHNTPGPWTEYRVGIGLGSPGPPGENTEVVLVTTPTLQNKPPSASFPWCCPPLATQSSRPPSPGGGEGSETLDRT
jgi:hypothetical protein